jgi:hypothetical protein
MLRVLASAPAEIENLISIDAIPGPNEFFSALRAVALEHR